MNSVIPAFGRPWQNFHVTSLPKITLAGDLHGNTRSEMARGKCFCEHWYSRGAGRIPLFPIRDGSVER